MKSLLNVAETNALIATGARLLIAGDETQLSQLVPGSWIGGTIPYFMAESGGLVSRSILQVTQLPNEATASSIRFYSLSEISQLPTHYAENGFSIIIMPGFSDIHHVFAAEGSSWPGLFTRPLVGWVSGVHLSDLGTSTPHVYNGKSGKVSSSEAVVMHLTLPEDRFARVDIINLFEEGSGDVITFETTGFNVTTCKVNGQETNFSDYLIQNKVDTQLPLVADYFGAKINVGLQAIDAATKTTQLYAPVFQGVDYRFAKPVGDYETEFAQRLKDAQPNPCFMCNCVLNFVYAKLENKRTGNMVGPMTFGEIAYMLLNQTLVYMTIEDSKPPITARH